jgi:hypothetical protein
MAETPSIERIIANTINDTARGDPDALAAHIVTAPGEAGYRILPANGMEDNARGSQPFDALTPEMRPRFVSDSLLEEGVYCELVSEDEN